MLEFGEKYGWNYKNIYTGNYKKKKKDYKGKSQIKSHKYEEKLEIKL